MIPSKAILIILILFVWLSVLFSILGVVNLNYAEIITYTLLLLGISVFYPSFNKNDKVGIFFGSTIFLVGITFFTISYFEITDTSQIIVPSVLMITAISLLMIFIADISDKKFLYIGLVVSAIGIYTIINTGSPQIVTFISSIKNMAGRSWIIILLILVTVIIIGRKRQED